MGSLATRVNKKTGACFDALIFQQQQMCSISMLAKSTSRSTIVAHQHQCKSALPDRLPSALPLVARTCAQQAKICAATSHNRQCKSLQEAHICICADRQRAERGAVYLPISIWLQCPCSGHSMSCSVGMMCKPATTCQNPPCLPFSATKSEARAIWCSSSCPGVTAAHSSGHEQLH